MTASMAEVGADHPLMARALRAYFRRCGRHTDCPGGPDGYLLLAGGRCRAVVLGNCNGTLARYAYSEAADRLRYVGSC
jgi:hypothetical protein